MIIQKADPVFMMPSSSVGRAHMFSPYKKLGSYYIDTLLFNLGVIWLMTVVLAITLYYNLLQRLMNFLERKAIP
ncbi:MAG: hypothetical protein R2744_07165 [Bacteroidales bacterium]